MNIVIKKIVAWSIKGQPVRDRLHYATEAAIVNDKLGVNILTIDTKSLQTIPIQTSIWEGYATKNI